MNNHHCHASTADDQSCQRNPKPSDSKMSPSQYTVTGTAKVFHVTVIERASVQDQREKQEVQIPAAEHPQGKKKSKLSNFFGNFLSCFGKTCEVIE